MDAEDIREIAAEFLGEANELLEQIDQDFVTLETQAHDKELVNRIFRHLHTIKGTARFLEIDPNFAKIADLSHAAEDFMDAVRQQKLVLQGSHLDLILEAVDQIKNLFEQVSQETTSSFEPEELVNRMRISLAAPSSQEATRESARRQQSQQSSSSPTFTTSSQARQNATIRVEASRLDSLMNLAGELVLGRNRLTQSVKKIQDFIAEQEQKQEQLQQLSNELTAASDFLDFITSDLQMAVLKTRMQPVGKIFNRFKRTVRDLAKDLGKEVNLLIQGAETEIDKSVIDEIGDPLMHLLRNALDHGIELPEERQKQGKKASGTLALSAVHEGNHILISIQDDGRGINLEGIKQRALAVGVVEKEELSRLSEKEILNLIFTPGFSTKENVTNVSGRGVGMDVVKSNIEKLNGSVEVSSQLGKGSTFTIRLPLTLAIIPALQVQINQEVFAIPQGVVVQTLRVSVHQIDTISGNEVMRFRNQVVPLIRLATLFSLIPKNKARDKYSYVVIVDIAEKRVGIIVDHILGQEEIVVKSLGNFLKSTVGIAGACIAGDGSVILILDVAGLVKLLPQLDRAKATVRLPRRSSSSSEEETSSSSEIWILIAEDARSERKKSKMILENEGYRVVEAVDGEEAMEKLYDKIFDLIITDIEMPGIDGYQFTQKIRQTREYKNVPVIAISARREMIDRIRGMEAGIDRYLPKPVGKKDLVQAVRNLLS